MAEKEYGLDMYCDDDALSLTGAASDELAGAE